MVTSAREVRGETLRSGAGLAELYERHAPGAVSLAYLLTSNREAAEDLVQEAFLRLTGRFRHLRSRDAFAAYLRQTVVNLFLSQMRRQRLEREQLSREMRRPESHAGLPDVEGRDEMWAALQELPPRQRAALVLRYYEDLSERDVAEVMRCSVAAAKSLVARGMEALRELMKDVER